MRRGQQDWAPLSFAVSRSPTPKFSCLTHQCRSSSSNNVKELAWMEKRRGMRRANSQERRDDSGVSSPEPDLWIQIMTIYQVKIIPVMLLTYMAHSECYVLMEYVDTICLTAPLNELWNIHTAMSYNSTIISLDVLVKRIEDYEAILVSKILTSVSMELLTEPVLYFRFDNMLAHHKRHNVSLIFYQLCFSRCSQPVFFRAC